MRKGKIQPKKLYFYTVFKRNDGAQGSYSKIVWEAIRGKVPEENWRRKMSEETCEVIAGTMEEAILKAKQKQGLEALLKRINRKTENGRNQSHNNPA